MYQRYRSPKILHALAGYLGTELQDAIKKTNKINKIPLNDSYRQYLNYYLGWGDYAKKAYKTDKKSIIFAKSVEKQSKIYKSQLRECQKSLDRNKYIIF